MLGKWLIDSIINESQVTTIVAIYPGRFQPMGKHHAAVYKNLANQFGQSYTYVATSDVVDPPTSPLNFNEKLSIINAHGISNVVQVKNPYKATEIIEKYDPATTAVVFAVGSKDMTDDARFRVGFKKNGEKTYFQYYDENKANLDTYRNHGYLLVVPHVSLLVAADTEMSGTTLRNLLATASPELFYDTMGFYDPKIYNMIKKKFQVNEAYSPTNILVEGGASGHINHPFDDRDLTFGEMKDLIRTALQGRLDIEGSVTEKTDGQNLNITFKNGRVAAARNKATIRNPMNIEELELKFGGRGEVTNAFTFAMQDLQSAIMALPAKTRTNIFRNGTRFANVEIIYPATKNVIDYGPAAYLQFHGINEFDLNTAEKINEYPKYGAKLQQLIADVNADTQKHFKIIPPNVLKLGRSVDFDVRSAYFINQVDALQQEFELQDSDELIMYHQRWWEQYIDKLLPNLDRDTREGLIGRWAYEDKTFRLNGKNIPNKALLAKVLEIDKDDFTKQNKSNIYKFEKIFLELGAEVLSNIRNFLAVNPDGSVQSIKKDIARAIKELQQTKDIKSLEILKYELKRIESIGGFEKIVPAEGIVFTYKGKTYKLTGLFAPINQLLGLTRYSR